MAQNFFDSSLFSEFWLPSQVNQDVPSTGLNFPDTFMLTYKLPAAIAVAYILREVSIRYVFTNWALRLNIKDTPSKKYPGEASDLVKFVEQCWMVVHEIGLLILGFFAVKNDLVFVDMTSLWVNYPFDSVSQCHEWFYICGMTMFVVESVAIMTRKHEPDCRLRVYHHALSFLLMAVSWLSNEVRFGTLLLFMFETFAPFFYAGRIAGWIKWPKTSQFFYRCLQINHVLVRLFWFHFLVLPNLLIVRQFYVEIHPATILSAALLIQLIVVNFIYIKLIAFQPKFFRSEKLGMHEKNAQDAGEAKRD